MKKERKDTLLHSFPSPSEEIKEQMKGRGAKNFVVFLTHGDELFARCYHRYYAGKIIERQRYVFAKDGCVRYIFSDTDGWHEASKFREPVFCSTSGYNASFDNSYMVLNIDAVKKSCMRYSCVDTYNPAFFMEYLRIYCRHPKIELLLKAGYDVIEETAHGYWGTGTLLTVNRRVDWNGKNVFEMLGLTREEFKLLKGSEKLYESYCTWREHFPECSPEDLLTMTHYIGCAYCASAKEMCESTGLTVVRLVRYLREQKIFIRDYEDYIKQCKHLKYNLTDTAICLPKNFHEMHERCSGIIRYELDEKAKAAFLQNRAMRDVMEFKAGDYIVIQPKGTNDIVYEGKALSHCVGGYAQRHAEGKLHIMFLRLAKAPDVPFYTIEVNTQGKIVQCRGYRNNIKTPKPKDISDFEKLYQMYLDGVFAKKMKARTTA